MAAPQTGITAEIQPHHYALEYTLTTDVAPAVAASAVGKALAERRNPGKIEEIEHVIAFGPTLCQALSLSRTPAGFETIAGKDGTSAPGTQNDLLIWMHGPERDRVFDAAMAINGILGGSFMRALEIPGFVRAESRDLTGFVDGSANPKGDLIAETAFIAGDQPDQGGSFVLTQRWVHDLPAFNALGVPEQESVIGRTKADSIELEGDHMPEDSHVSRTDVAVAGETQRIYRRSFPYGTLAEHGLYFLAFACDQSRFDLQLRRMYGVTEDGIRDRITDFSTAVTGSYYYAPSRDELQGLVA